MNSRWYTSKDSWQLPSTSSGFAETQADRYLTDRRKIRIRMDKTVLGGTHMGRQTDPDSLIETMKKADEITNTAESCLGTTPHGPSTCSCPSSEVLVTETPVLVSSNQVQHTFLVNLINLVDEVDDLVVLDVEYNTNHASKHEERGDREQKKRLPRQAIIFDYTLQPVGMLESKRVFLPTLATCTPPFLRPIVIDGLGVVKAYRNCCSTDTQHPEFPFVALIRCLFYWLAKGHSTLLCFPMNFNPLHSNQFNASAEEKHNLQQLANYKLLMLFQADDSKQWYQRLLDKHRACLITTVTQWRMQMPNNLHTGVFSADGDRDLGRRYIPKSREECPERLLQPFFSQKGQLVFFSSFSSTGQSLATIILDQSAVNSQEEFDQLNKLQLSFISQCKNLKLLFDLMNEKGGGEDKRFRETNVMIKLLQRLKHFLP